METVELLSDEGAQLYFSNATTFPMHQHQTPEDADDRKSEGPRVSEASLFVFGEVSACFNVFCPHHHVDDVRTESSDKDLQLLPSFCECRIKRVPRRDRHAAHVNGRY